MNSHNHQQALIQAKASASQNSVKAEKLFRGALELAVKFYGENSAEVGLCLLELAEFMEKNGRLLEAEKLTRRYRLILRTLAMKNGIE